jgi:hypothetical protein
MGSMKRTQVQLDDATYDLVRRRAFEDRRSISAVIRETLAAAFETGRKPATRLTDLSFVGSGRSSQRPGHPVSEHHDDALADATRAPAARR